MTDNNLNQVPESSQEQGENQVKSQTAATNDAILGALKNQSQSSHKIKREYAKFQKGDTVRQQIERKRALQTPENWYMGESLEYRANKVDSKLRSGLRWTHDVDLVEMKDNGSMKISIRPKHIIKREEPEIAFTIEKNGVVNIKVSPYDEHYNEYGYCYNAKGLDLNLAVYSEMKYVVELLKTGVIPQGSSLEKQNYAVDNDYIPIQVEDLTVATPNLQDKRVQRRMEATEAFENMNELLPIQTGTLTAYNPELKKGVIVPSIHRGSCDVYFDENSTIPNVGDSVNYVKVMSVAFLTSVGQVKKVVEKTPTEEDETSSIVFVTPHDNSKTDVALKTGQNDFSEGDTVEFVANKADKIIAIQKK